MFSWPGDAQFLHFMILFPSFISMRKNGDFFYAGGYTYPQRNASRDIMLSENNEHKKTLNWPLFLDVKAFHQEYWRLL